MTSSNHSRDVQRGNRTPNRANKGPGLTRSPGKEYCNNLSPFRARPPIGNKRNSDQGRTPDRNKMKQTSRSPLRRDLKINTEFGRESNHYNSYAMNENARRPLSPISRR